MTLGGSPRFLRRLARWVAASCACYATSGIVVAVYFAPFVGLPEPVLVGVFSAEAKVSRDWVLPDRLRKGETLSTLLYRNGYVGNEQYELIQALGALIPLRKLRAGHEVEFRYGPGGAPAVWVRHGRTERVHAWKGSDGWEAELVELPISVSEVALSGSLEGNLFDSMSRLGEGPSLVVAFARVFQWDFDFHSQSRRGDRFALVFEKQYQDGKFVGYGELKAASYQSGAKALSAFLFVDGSGHRDYYDVEGKSMKKAFLRAPLTFERISSGFSYSRLHPVHGTRRPHLAVDYAADSGTPVHSIATGVVDFRGRNGGAGNMVTIRHPHGYVSSYLHLSRFASGLRKGSRVEQKQVIGYVGMTGTATGPHLDFRLKKNGKAVNPLKQIYPPGPPVEEQYRSAFASVSAKLAAIITAVQQSQSDRRGARQTSSLQSGAEATVRTDGTD